ncbi:uncharacterized protein P174DRAFT_445998 [Aspergillus novofumigatus IBT 16806]|uniref:Mannose-binding lectin n=1 Tax=Aspergillus novofumigatus (strain IBT 16806) TaxID=1392255 RepID=A0A2I1BVS9_ASPN1|nr:uncharacterized protein P174DRAFT_445998 [Aspergillus novofumigatus IBT 16806]PKX89488.1 hypothetical protein P174DRAFT_445998 [Aspergillus novofumigatus IBT 16806]
MPEHQTPSYGKNNNNPFFLYPNKPSTVKRLEAWSGWGSGDSQNKWVVKGIKLTWFNGEQKSIYNHAKDEDKYAQYEFGTDESADWSIRSGWRIDRIEFDTSKGHHWSAGGDSGDLHSHIANGFLLGFEGSAGWEVDYISMRYKSA